MKSIITAIKFAPVVSRFTIEQVSMAKSDSKYA